MICRALNKPLSRNELSKVEETCFRVISFCNSSSLKQGVCVHSPIIKLGLHNDLYLHNNLLSLYSKCFGVNQARHLFDEMPEKDVVSWTSMQSAYIRNDNHEEALGLFYSMMLTGQYPNDFTLTNCLRSCSALGELDLGSSIHGFVVKAGFEARPILTNTLVDCYAKSNCSDEAYKVFRDMGNNGDTVSWTTMISSLVQSQKWSEALQFYILMIKCRITPNEFTFVKLLGAASFLGLKHGELLHAHLVNLGIHLNVVLKTALVDMYFKCQKLDYATKVLNQTPEYDVLLWTSIISGFGQNLKIKEVISALNKMKISGVMPNSFTYSSILCACKSTSSLELGWQIHSQVILAGLEADVCVASALIDMYMKCSCQIDEALRVFKGIPFPNVICWTSLMAGMVEHGYEQHAFDCFAEMQMEGVEPNSFTLLTMLGAVKCQSEMFNLHAYVIKGRAGLDIPVDNALVDAYAGLGMYDDAWRVISGMSSTDVITYTSLATRANQMGHYEIALKTITYMYNDDVKMDGVSLAGFLSASAGIGSFGTGKQLHCYSVKSGLDCSISVKNSLLDFYGKSGCVNYANRVFEEMSEPDAVSWNCLICTLASNGQISFALSSFDNMRIAGFSPDSVTFMTVLFACSQGGLVDLGLEYFKSMRETHGIDPGFDHYVSLVDLLGRAGRLEEAMGVVESMPFKPDALIYKTLLASCTLHGNVLLGEDMFRRGLELDPSDASFYLLLARLYDDYGSSDLSVKTRKLMRERGLRKNPSQSWTEIRSKVHIFVTGDRSHPQVNEIEEKIESLVSEFKKKGWFYRNDEITFSHSEKLAIAFGILSTPSQAAIRITKNTRICRECHDFVVLVTKVIQREIIVRDGNKIHVFKNGECSCKGYQKFATDYDSHRQCVIEDKGLNCLTTDDISSM